MLAGVRVLLLPLFVLLGKSRQATSITHPVTDKCRGWFAQRFGELAGRVVKDWKALQDTFLRWAQVLLLPLLFHS